jgi:ribosomal RNA-processing protein 9
MSRVRRKNNNSQTGAGAGGPSKKSKTLDLGWKNGQGDEHIDSDAEEDYDYQETTLDTEEVEEEETLDAKKIRLARQYLQKLEAGDSDDETSSSSDDQDDDQEEDEHDKLGLKLQRERLKREGALERVVADKVEKSITSFQTSIQTTSDSEKEAQEWIEADRVKLLRGHDLTPTCVALQSNGEKAISGSKDHSVIIWDVERSQKSVTLCDTWKQKKDSEVSRTNGEVLSVACSDDGRYASVGKRDATVCIYDVRLGKNNLVKTFTGHKGAVTSLCFRTQSLQLFSGSDDRCIRYDRLNESYLLKFMLSLSTIPHILFSLLQTLQLE